MTEKRFEFREVNNCGITPKVWDKEKQKYANLLECVDCLNDLHKENEQLKQSIDIIGGRLQGLWANYYSNRWGIWSEAVEDIANELGFKIHHAYDDPISNSESKKERIKGVKKITEILRENELIKKENKQLKKDIETFTRTNSTLHGS